ncbi:DUF4864 domain-containing protein [Vannielia litorea]|uniref:DUF4864 domain-containing protein n=1 Tax=Vannielia litorea TaxID=1217970 RepID=UPI001C964047|nr:DUF4864 domain-containing protein [Vannielia litorea]MBY6048591.1 DUF4864 domain-containing protein [Vannielia litorea]MBY6076005.1 DUF4864 domain-containing protein [Vannielia litorea]
MRFIGLSLALLLAAPVAQAQEASAIPDVIGSQLEAFEADDFARAFTFASPMIQGMFRTPENFGAMVREGYPMVHRPGAVTFGTQRTEGGSTYQTVTIRDAEGRYHALEYEMIPGGEGGWLIDGVSFIPAPDVSA